MKISEIISRSNILADDSIAENEVYTFVSRAISKINLDAPALFYTPEFTEIGEDYYVMKTVEFVDDTNKTDEELKLEKQLKTINEMFINMILIQYVVYSIKQQDGSEYEWNLAWKEWDKNMKQFITKYKQFIDEDYLTDGITEDGYEVGIAVVAGQPTGNVATWGPDPSSGTGNIFSGTANSALPYGGK